MIRTQSHHHTAYRHATPRDTGKECLLTAAAPTGQQILDRFNFGRTHGKLIHGRVWSQAGEWKSSKVSIIFPTAYVVDADKCQCSECKPQ